MFESTFFVMFSVETSKKLEPSFRRLMYIEDVIIVRRVVEYNDNGQG